MIFKMICYNIAHGLRAGLAKEKQLLLQGPNKHGSQHHHLTT
jgi:hypothetical protein